jgi:hypothetical protein
MIKKTSLIAGFLATAIVQQVSAQVIFSDNFELGNMNNWTTTGSNPLTIDNTQNVEPSGGTFSAYMNISTDRMHRNLGLELSGASTFTSYIYDAGGTASRIFNEVRGYAGGTGLPNGGTVASGTLSQLLAIGKYNSVTLAGDVFDGTKYQARSILGVNGWFNLNAPTAPSRSVGWHRFDIERLADGTTINYYVDGLLGRTITGTGLQDWDTMILGPGLGSTVGDAWIDGMSVNVGAPITVPEPSIVALGVMGGLAFFGSVLRRRFNK